MRIAVLGVRGSWHAEQFIRAGRNLGVDVAIVEYRQLVGRLVPGARLQAEGFELTSADRVLVRHIPVGNLEQVVFRMDALAQAEQAGVRVVNSSRAIETCVDKYLATARIEAAGLPVPPTVVCEDVASALAAFDDLGGDCLLKPMFGSEGRGILRLDHRELAARALDAVARLGQILYLQKFVQSVGYDLRALVVGDQVVAAMKRTAEHDFRTNASLGGRCEPFELPKEWKGLAVRAARAVGAEIAGIDLLPPLGSDVPLILEANSAPGFQALSRVSDLPIAETILGHVVG